MNQSLRLPKGKLAAQVAHAAVGAYLEAQPAAQQAWLDQGMPKVVLGAATAEELLVLQKMAEARDIAHCLIEDAGRTVIPAGTITCLGLGPAEDEAIDVVTGTFKLL